MKIFYIIKLLSLILNTAAEDKAGRILIEKNLKLAIAESCTGGLLSSLMTDVSGSSSYIHANFVTYANEAKMKFLNVSDFTLGSHGAVSIETAQEMVQGLLNNTGSDIAVATTGVAGPTGGSEQKPVGLVYIGVGMRDNIKVFKYNVNPKYPRRLVKYLFAKRAAKLLCEFLEENVK